MLFNMKQIRLTESQLYNIISNSIKCILKENIYDNEFNDIYNEYMSFNEKKEKEYGTPHWYVPGYANNVKPDDVQKRKELEQKLNQISKLWNAEDDKEEDEKKENRRKSIKECNNIINLAIQSFGITKNIRQAGYILPDGRFLNFGSYGSRETDHRAIEGIYKSNNIPIWSDEYRYNYVVDFMNRGAIRCDVNNGLLDMTREPTQEQYNALKMFARYSSDIYLDFTDNNGNNIHSIEYDNPKPQKLVMDIYNFYHEGIKA